MKKFLLLLILLSASFPAFAAEKESAFDRVMRTNTLRCGYINYPPALIKDPKTGALSGIFYDFANALGKDLSLKVQWVQESTWATYIQDLKTGRFDALCSMAWKNPDRARAALPTTPLYYSTMLAWVRTNDTRFDHDVMKANDSQYKVATLDGTTVDTLAHSDFPRAQLFSLPQTADISQIPLTVSSGKADLTFLEKYVGEQFLAHNPGALKSIGPPLRAYADVMWVPQGEYNLKVMLDAGIEDLLNTNLLPTLYKKYNIPAGAFAPVAKPYEVEK